MQIPIRSFAPPTDEDKNPFRRTLERRQVDTSAEYQADPDTDDNHQTHQMIAPTQMNAPSEREKAYSIFSARSG